MKLNLIPTTTLLEEGTRALADRSKAEESTKKGTLRGGTIGGFFEQRVITGGKLGLSRKSEEQIRQAAEHMQETNRLQVLTTVRRLYYQALGEQRLISVRKDLAGVAERTDQGVRESSIAWPTTSTSPIGSTPWCCSGSGRSSGPGASWVRWRSGSIT